MLSSISPISSHLYMMENSMKLFKNVFQKFFLIMIYVLKIHHELLRTQLCHHSFMWGLFLFFLIILFKIRQKFWQWGLNGFAFTLASVGSGIIAGNGADTSERTSHEMMVGADRTSSFDRFCNAKRSVIKTCWIPATKQTKSFQQRNYS